MARAIVAHALQREITGPIAALHAVLDRTLPPHLPAQTRIDLESLPGEAVLHVENDGAAESVQAEHRIGAQYRGAIDGDQGNQIPVDAVPLGFVDAHAVLVDGEALRSANHRRGGETAIVDFRLEGVAGRVNDRHAGRAPFQRLRKIALSRVREFGGADGCNAAGIFHAFDAGVGRIERRRYDDLDCVETIDAAWRLRERNARRNNGKARDQP